MESSRHTETNDSTRDSNGVGAGAARALARQTRYIKAVVVRGDTYLARWVSRADIGSFPRKVSAKSVGRLSDNLAKAKDFYDSWQEGTTKRQQHVHANQSTQSKLGVHLGKVSRSNESSTMHRLPLFMKNFLLGTALFSVYEGLDEKLTTTIVPELQPNTKVWHGLTKSSVAALAGTSAGACHGTLSFLYESIIENRSLGGSNIKARFGGILIAHSLAHGTLFGTYEFVKHSALDMTGTNPSRWGGIAAVAAAGAVAGVAQEAMSYYTTRMERSGICRGLRAARRLPLPGLQRIIGSAPGSSLGFLAFEYGRLVASELVEDVENQTH